MAQYQANRSLRTRASKKSVYTYAANLSARLNYIPADGELRRIVEEDLRGRIVYDDPTHWDIEQSGSLIVNSDDTFEITLPNATAVTRDNFTIAHELGHFFLHALAGNIFSEDNSDSLMQLDEYSIADLGIDANADAIVFARYDTGELEWEANWFAAAFLIPTNALKEAKQRYSNDLASIAAHFRVSQEVVTHRLSYHNESNI